MPNLRDAKKVSRKAPAKLADEINAELTRRMQDARDSLQVELNPDDPSLVTQLSLGDNWDDPETLARSLDLHPLWYARWATLKVHLRRKLEVAESKYKVWESAAKDTIKSSLFEANQKKGMTANNARPTIPDIESKFNKNFVAESGVGHSQYATMKGAIDEVQDELDIVEIIVKAFDRRTDTLIGYSNLVRMMIDKGYIQPPKKLR